MAMRFRTMQAGPVMQMPVFLVLFFAPVYVPLALLNGWIETVATVNPLTYVLEAVRSLLAATRCTSRSRSRWCSCSAPCSLPGRSGGCGAPKLRDSARRLGYRRCVQIAGHPTVELDS